MIMYEYIVENYIDREIVLQIIIYNLSQDTWKPADFAWAPWEICSSIMVWKFALIVEPMMLKHAFLGNELVT